MTSTIIIVIIGFFLMTLTLVFLLKKEVNDINSKSKIYFTKKAQEYTDSIKRDDSSPKREEISKEENNKDKNNNKEDKKSVIYVEKDANYEIDDLLKIMKQIDVKFATDNTKTILNFIKTYVTDDKDQLKKYDVLMEMKKYITEIGLFNIMVNDNPEEIEEITKKLRLMNEDIYMEFSSNRETFDVSEFCNYLDYEIGKCDPTIYVYVGDKKLNYNAINKKIQTKYSQDIYKGIKIVYLNKLYDYSLS